MQRKLHFSPPFWSYCRGHATWRCPARDHPPGHSMMSRSSNAPLTIFSPPLRWDHSAPLDAEERWRRYIRATFMLLVLRDPPERIAAFFDISRRTVYEWRDRVLASDRPEAEGIRRLIEDVRRTA